MESKEKNVQHKVCFPQSQTTLTNG